MKTVVGIVAVFAATILASGCLFMGKPVPPTAPCVYQVTALNSGSVSTDGNTVWDAESDLKINGSTVTFTNCYGGSAVTLHGRFSVEKIVK